VRPTRAWRRPALLLAAVLVCWAAGPGYGAAATAVAVALLAWSWVRQPVRPCWKCGGSGARFGRIWQGTLGRCKACEGDKVQVRWGVKTLMPGYAKKLKQGRPTRYGP